MFEDFEDIDGWQATSGFTGSSVSINTNTTKVNGTYSGQVDYTLGIGYGRIYIDKTNLELTNATKISIWVYGDNSDSILTLGLNNNKNSKIDWHWSTPITIDWIGWREVSININELSQRSLMYISGADTVRIKLEKWGGGVDDSTILIDELIAEKVGSHTEFDDVVCGVCHGSMHDLQLSPQCNYCHQTQDHG
ncbi:MAG: hypothetical protein E4G94_00755 [ANME-2 cluster archaeon]|nr:MAG: hypothetical protein E4G94_00755 [ANME-2 cluster archaeon]